MLPASDPAFNRSVNDLSCSHIAIKVETVIAKFNHKKQAGQRAKRVLSSKPRYAYHVKTYDQGALKD